MLLQGLMKSRTIIDYDVVIGKVGLGKMMAAFGAENPDLVGVSMQLHVGFMHQFCVLHHRLPL